MHPSIRAAFAACLWLAALTPLVLQGVSLRSPAAAVGLAVALAAALRWAGLAALALALLALVLWPPFWPGLRLWARGVKRRLATDPAPLLEAQARLRHADSAADHLTAGRILAQQGRPADALPHLARAVELDPAHLASRRELALALARLGQLQSAAGQLAHVVKADEGFAFGEALLELGEILERGGADAEAAEVLARHARRFGFHPRAALHRGRALARLGQHEPAREALRAAAAPPEPGRHRTPEEDLARARARVALLALRRQR